MRRTIVVAGLLLSQCFTTTAWAAKHRPEERMDVADVLAAGDGQFVVVLKTSTKPARYLPIWVGESDAVALKMRLDRRAPSRPLTLNLLEQLLRATNVKVLEIAIDDFRDGAFLGKIRLKQNAHTWEMEARPSDAIGLAMGKHVPILVAKDIVDGAAIDPSTLKNNPKKQTAEDDSQSSAHTSIYDETL